MRLYISVSLFQFFAATTSPLISYRRTGRNKSERDFCIDNRTNVQLCKFNIPSAGFLFDSGCTLRCIINLDVAQTRNKSVSMMAQGSYTAFLDAGQRPILIGFVGRLQLVKQNQTLLWQSANCPVYDQKGFQTAAQLILFIWYVRRPEDTVYVMAPII